MITDFTVRKKYGDLIVGIIDIILFIPLFILMVILHINDSNEIPFIFVLISFLLVLLGVFVIYDGIRPKITVKNETITYYAKFRTKKEINPYEITQKCRSSDKRQIGADAAGAAWGGIIGGALGGIIGGLIGKKVAPPSPPEIITYTAHGKTVLGFKTTMKNADLLEQYIDSVRPPFQEINK